MVAMCESLPLNQRVIIELEGDDACMDSPADRQVGYKLDSGMSQDEIIQGFMDIVDLPDEPHKYYSSSRRCTKT